MENQKICPMCGLTMEADVAFCPRCGASVDGQSFQASVQQPGMSVQTNSAPAAKFDFTQTVKNNLIAVICLGIGLTLFFVGVVWPAASQYLSIYNMPEYVGSDASNMMIQASLQGGRIAGTMICKCLLICIGLFISCISAMKVKFVKPE